MKMEPTYALPMIWMGREAICATKITSKMNLNEKEKWKLWP